MKYLILMAARHDDKGFEIADLEFRIADLKEAGSWQKTKDGRLIVPPKADPWSLANKAWSAENKLAYSLPYASCPMPLAQSRCLLDSEFFHCLCFTSCIFRSPPATDSLEYQSIFWLLRL